MSTTPDLSWMGQRSTYQGPSLTEIKALEHKKQTAKQTLFINKLPETVELKDHPWFIGVQFHPEFKSRPLSPHPLFSSFIKAAKINSKK